MVDVSVVAPTPHGVQQGAGSRAAPGAPGTRSRGSRTPHTHHLYLLLSITQAASQRNRVSRVVEAAYCVINREVSFRACVTEVCFCILMMIDARKAISGVS